MDILTGEGRFKYCVGIVIKHEGGLSMDKRDPGGVTKWGISLRFLRAIGLDIDGDGDVDEHDIIAINKPGASEIYREYWWDKYHYNALNELPVAAKVFDLSVNMGAMAAHKLLQIAINRLADKSISVDGILGGKTLGAANLLDGNKLRQELRVCAEHKYIQILADKPAMEWARKGWLARAAW